MINDINILIILQSIAIVGLGLILVIQSNRIDKLEDDIKNNIKP